MLTLTRALVGGFLVVALAIVAAPPGDALAQAKKDDKKEPAKAPPPAKKEVKKGTDDSSDRSVSFGTSDGLALNGYFFQGTATDKQRPDGVLMFPAPGNKVTDAWVDLAKELSKRNFSVLLFDWRGHGRNGPEAGSRIFESPDLFWRENYNLKLLKNNKATIDDKGLDWKAIGHRSERELRYRDMLLNDLAGARFFLDKKSDEGRCNTNRVWIVSEKDGANLGLGFIATEFHRNSIYNPNPELGKIIQIKLAGKDYAGMVALSYAPNSDTGRRVFSAATQPGVARTKEIHDHLESRLATVLVYTKKEGSSYSKGLISMLRGGGTEDQMKKNFKYLREVDVGNKTISGIGIFDPMDTYKIGELIQTAMVEISKVQNFGKDTTDREANKMSYAPRFPFEYFNNRGR